MEANELKIGNIVNKGIVFGIIHLEGQRVCYILESKFSSISKTYLIEEVEPVELTEEWLFKFGFVLLERKGRYGNIYAISEYDSDLCIERDFNKHTSYFVGIEYTDSLFPEDEGKSYHFSFDLRYVHQLQNLYFAITHNELHEQLLGKNSYFNNRV